MGWRTQSYVQPRRQTAAPAEVNIAPAPFTGLDGMRITRGKLLVFEGGKECTLVDLTGRLGNATFEIKEVGRRNRFGPTARLETASTIKTLVAQGLTLAEAVLFVSSHGEPYTSQDIYRPA